MIQLGSGKHGDAMRLLAGGGSAANQIEYTNKYGSALPVFFSERQRPSHTAEQGGAPPRQPHQQQQQQTPQPAKRSEGQDQGQRSGNDGTSDDGGSAGGGNFNSMAAVERIATPRF